MDSFTILIFTWNAAGLRLCETASQSKANAARTGITSYLTFKKSCLAPDFFENIRDYIRGNSPSLVVITTQEEDNSGSYFHSDLLQNMMPEINYTFLKKDKLSNIGEIPSNNLLPKIATGNPSGSALRISIFARNDVFPQVKTEEKILNNFFGNDGQINVLCQQGPRVSGAVASYVWHPKFGRFVFIAAHLPVGAAALQIKHKKDYASFRAASKAANTLCLIGIMDKFVNDLPTDAAKNIKYFPDHVFLMGDLNYDIAYPTKSNRDAINELVANITPAKLKELKQHDELQKALTEVPLEGFHEGVADNGPLFLPTWRLERGRGDECNMTASTTKIPSTCFADVDNPAGGLGWRDRILYQDDVTDYITHCLAYDRLDVGNIHESTHAAVYGLYELKQ